MRCSASRKATRQEAGAWYRGLIIEKTWKSLRLELGHAPLLRSIHPLVIYQIETQKVHFLNARRGKRQAEYLCYLDGGKLKQEASADWQELLAHALDMPVDDASLHVWATQSAADDPALSGRGQRKGRLPAHSTGRSARVNHLGGDFLTIPWEPHSYDLVPSQSARVHSADSARRLRERRRDHDGPDDCPGAFDGADTGLS